MDHTLLQKAIDRVPQTEEERLLVLKWVISVVKDSNDQDSPEVSDSERRQMFWRNFLTQPVSEKRSGSSVHDRPVKDQESTASPGGPKVVVTTQHTSTKDTTAKPACKDAYQQEELEDPPSKRWKITEDDLHEDHVLAEFNPSSLTEPKEGKCKVLQMMAKYLSKWRWNVSLRWPQPRRNC